jgi:cytoskeletal protein RodZ
MAEIGIGATLRETRMRARIDIGEVEARTKIRAKYLRAIENEEWDLLPGPIYVKSFLRTYGEYLGLDSRLLLDEYKRRYERPTEHDLRPLSSIRREREKVARGPRPPLLPPRLWIGVVLLIVLAALFLIGKLGPTSSNNNASSSIHHAHRGASHLRTRKRTTRTTTGTTTTKTTTAAAVATLSMVPTGQIWVCVESRNGNKLINGVTYNAGQTIPAQRRQQLFVSLGNANVKLTINGKPYPLSASSTAIGLKITPQGATPLANRPTCA